MIVGGLLLNLMTYAGNPMASASYWKQLPWYNFNPSYSAMQPFGNEILNHPDLDAWRDHYKVNDLVEVPTLLTTGWFDFFVTCQINDFIALQERGIPVKLIIGPGTHGSPPSIPVYEWFDYWLKGIDNGIMDEPPIKYYCLEANEWRWADQWPPEEIQYVNYYLREGGSLSIDSPDRCEEPDSYTYDPANPVITRGGANLMLSSGSLDQTPVVIGRNDILSYTGSPLTEDVEIAGHLTVVLSVSSNCLDTDFTAKLIDVRPTGELMLVADGIIRARYRDSMAEPELMEPGTIYTIRFDIGNICYLFQAGHSIRLDISSSNFPKYDRNLNTGGVLYKEATWTVAENTIYHDADNPSYIILPVVAEEVDIDIEPWRYPNLIIVKGKGVVSVAILTTEDFDARAVDPETVRFGPGLAKPLLAGIIKRFPFLALKDVDRDGDRDMVLMFWTQETGIRAGDTSATLTGVSYTDWAFFGRDAIVTCPR